MILTCVTSRYLPNLRHIARLCEVDVAVVLDLAPLPHRNRDSFVARNRIYQQVRDEEFWLTVPVIRHGRRPRMQEAEIDPTDHRWARKHLLTMRHAYPHADEAAPGFLAALGDALHTDTHSLFELNMTVLRVLISTVGFEQKMPALQSSFISDHRKGHRLDVTVAAGADAYMAGDTERRLIDEAGLEESFVSAGVALLDSSKVPPELYREAVRYSVVHVICTQGVKAARVMLDRLIEVQGAKR